MAALSFSAIASGVSGTPWEAAQEVVSGVPTAVLTRRVERFPDLSSNSNPITDLKKRDGEKPEFHPLTSENVFKPKYHMGTQTGLAGSPAIASVSRAGATDRFDTRSRSEIRFGDLATVKAMGTGEESIVVGFDTEFTDTDTEPREILSYQFSLIDPDDASLRIDLILMPLEPERLTIEDCLALVIRLSGLWRVAGLPDPAGFVRSSFWVSETKKRSSYSASVERLFKMGKVKMVLAGHFLQADLTAFRRGRSKYDDVLRRVTSASGGLVSLKPIRLIARPGARGSTERWLPISLTVRDSMCQAAPGAKALADLGRSCGVEKIDIGDAISDMRAFRDEHLIDYLEYSANDARIVLEYLSALWGEGVVPPVTLSGGGARALRAGCKDYWWGADVPNSLFTARFQGLIADAPETETADSSSDNDGLSYYSVRRLKPIDGDANQIHSAFKKAFHGGWNGCSEIGFFPMPTFDHDLQSAYPSAMASILDPDFEAGCIEEVIKDRELALEDFPQGFVTPLVAYVDFSFPGSVEFPSIPAKIGQSVVYLRSSRGLGAGGDPELSAAGIRSFEGAWACAPELLLALKLGARVRVQIGYRLKVLETHGEPSRSLRFAVKQMVEDRAVAKAQWGKKSLEELTIKVATNSCYGKTAQDVSERNGWNAWQEEMESVGGSAISSPYHAAMTTSLVRAILLAIANELPPHSFLSVTTDGFISTVEDIEQFPCFGLAAVFQEARGALVGDPSVWEIKHRQSDLVNLTTRGNVSLSPSGVFAKAGLKVPDSIRCKPTADAETKRQSDLNSRVWFRETAVSREGKIVNHYTRFPSFRELSRSKDREDFRPVDCEPLVSLDFDMKREPDESSIRTASVDGHDLACFSTKPWSDANAYSRGRQIARHIASMRPGTTGEHRPTGALRSPEHWDTYFRRYRSSVGRRVRTADSALLTELVAAYKEKLIAVPELDACKSVAEKLSWLGSLGLGEFTRAQWDHMSKVQRRSAVLRDCDLGKVLELLESVSSDSLGSAA